MGSGLFSLLLIIGLLSVFFLLGSLITCRWGNNEHLVLYSTLIGFFVYFSFYHCVALPMKISLRKLSELSVTWLVILCILVVFIIFFNKNKWIVIFHQQLKRKDVIIKLLFVVGIIIQAIIITNNIQYGSFIDASYYIADSGKSVATNTIEQYNQYTGMLRDELDPLYLLLTYTSHSSVLGYVTGIHPLVIWRQVMASIVIILANITIYLTAYYVLQKNNRLAFYAWVCWVFVQTFTYSTYSSSGFMFYRAFEGKTVLAIIIIPFFIMQMIRSILNQFSWYEFCIATIGLIGSLPFCMSTMMIVPVVISMFYFPGLILYKKKKILLQYCILVGICMCELLCYMLISKGVFRVYLH